MRYQGLNLCRSRERQRSFPLCYDFSSCEFILKVHMWEAVKIAWRKVSYIQTCEIIHFQRKLIFRVWEKEENQRKILWQIIEDKEAKEMQSENQAFLTFLNYIDLETILRSQATVEQHRTVLLVTKTKNHSKGKTEQFCQIQQIKVQVRLKFSTLKKQVLSKKKLSLV